MNKQIRSFWHDPIVHFFVIAVVLLAGHALYQTAFRDDIVLTQDALDAMVLADAKESKRYPSYVTSKALVAHYLETEILYQEALKRDMLADPDVKAFLAQKLRTELEPIERQLTETELRTLYAQASEQHQYPAKIAFEHVSFAPDSTRIPARLVARLNDGADPRQFGEQIQMANPIPATFKPQLDRVLGEQASDKVFQLSSGQWHGPINSPKGIHYIRVLQKTEAQAVPFEALRNTLQSNWAEQQKQQAIDNAVTEMSKHYRIRLPADYKDLLPQ